ncbi:MAG: 16S rRNA (cytosine(1402)-N(4))-methyltransferase RsmH [Bacilli bacterium]|nr:16S rRNA (cytosine(1402)-N(4))-methyltransferase RsmH [Bacilli bacterium]
MHKSVLLEEVLTHLNLNENSKVIDCTLGYGGHSSEILKRIKKGFLFAFDQDSDAISYSKKKLSKIGNNFEIIKSNFVDIKKYIKEPVDAILYDLGVSSPQLDVKERGFSFHNDAELDMRMDKEQTLSAKEVVNNYSESKLTEILFKYGEEKYAKSIARKIVLKREEKLIETTLELVNIISSSVPEKYKRDHHPARKSFQAIRIEVNNELEVFKSSLLDSLELLKINGRICVITFHSLEDKICKDVFKKVSSVDKSLNKLPIIPEHLLPKYKLVDNVLPSEKEVDENKRSRSAKLRIIERIR